VIAVSERLGPLTATERAVNGPGVTVVSAPMWTPEQIAAHVADADFVVLGAIEPFTAEVLASLPNLAAVVRRGVGHDNVDVAAATRLGIVVANVPDASVEEVSDHALALCLGLERRVPTLASAVRSGRWAGEPSCIQAIAGPSRRFGELCLGVVGLGRIGRALARKAQSVYGRIIGFDPVAVPADGSLALVDFAELLATADHVSLHMPLTAQNRGLFGDDVLASMKHGSILVNTARGGLVDEAALVRALRAGQLAGAALDVTAREPLPADDPLMAAGESLWLTGHAAAWGVRSTAELRRSSMRVVEDLLHGRRPASVLNPDVLQAASLRHGVT
jgi:D-3-phosphoglycerate dehydrogenase